MSRETLKDAQKNPKNYPDLIVKVSGYSFRFIDLSKALQNDIIERTELRFKGKFGLYFSRIFLRKRKPENGILNSNQRKKSRHRKHH